MNKKGAAKKTEISGPFVLMRAENGFAIQHFNDCTNTKRIWVFKDLEELKDGIVEVVETILGERDAT